MALGNWPLASLQDRDWPPGLLARGSKRHTKVAVSRSAKPTHSCHSAVVPPTATLISSNVFRRELTAGGRPPDGNSAERRRYPACDRAAFVTLLSSRVTPFHSRNAGRRSVAEPGADWRTSALDGAKTMLDALTRVDGIAGPRRPRRMRAACSVMQAALAHEMCAADDLLIEAVQTAALLHDVGKLADSRSAAAQARSADARGIRSGQAACRDRRRPAGGRRFPGRWR